MSRLKWPRGLAEEGPAAPNDIGIRVPISAKLGAALIVPLLTLVVLAVIQVQQSRQDAAAVREEVRLVEAAMGPNGLATGLHFERTTASLTVIDFADGIEIPYETDEAARAPTDQALEEFEEVLAKSPRAQEIYGPVLTNLISELQDLRAFVDESLERKPELDNVLLENVGAADEIFDRYSALMAELLDANMAVAVEIEHPELRQGAELSAMAGRQMDAVTHLSRHLLWAGLPPVTFDQPETLTTVGVNLHTFQEGHDALLQIARDDYADLGATLAADINQLDFGGRVEGYIEAGEVDINDVIDAINYKQEESYLGFRDGLETVIQDQASDMESAANTRFRMYFVTAFLVVLFATAVTYIVSQSITRPLRSLTTQATKMAHDRLPDAVQTILEKPLGEDVTVPHVDPVSIKTRDEVADVARALNTVQDSALQLAAEQAVLRRNIADTFVNLGRRNQKLLGRQIDFITDLEQGETDPDVLANLFRLDHLATRMRRNAESLLVLGGIEPPRKWAVPVRLTDVIRAALGEVEDYQRVVLRAVEPVTIVGSAAADIAHLLAELIENALAFSPPDQVVEIRGRNHPASQPAAAGQPGAPTVGYTIAIIDSGVGMPSDEIERANRRLAGTESFTVAPSKYLGHYVAGNLAARHNVDVQLLSSPGKGITATTYLPPNLIALEAQPQAMGAGAQPRTGPPPVPGQPEMGPPGFRIPAVVQVPTPPEGEYPVYEQSGEHPVYRPSGEHPVHEGAPPDMTVSGLPRRTPGSRHRPGQTVGSQPSDEDLIHSLGGYTDRLGPSASSGPPGVDLPDSGLPRPPVISGETPTVPPTNRAPAGGGLARRVKGAQLPTLQPPLIRRDEPAPDAAESDVHAPDMATLSGLRRGSAAERRRAPRRAPKDVYNFLANFTTGVQRGLEEAHGSEPPPSGGNGAPNGADTPD